MAFFASSQVEGSLPYTLSHHYQFLLCSFSIFTLIVIIHLIFLDNLIYTTKNSSSKITKHAQRNLGTGQKTIPQIPKWFLWWLKIPSNKQYKLKRNFGFNLKIPWGNLEVLEKEDGAQLKWRSLLSFMVAHVQATTFGQLGSSGQSSHVQLFHSIPTFALGLLYFLCFVAIYMHITFIFHSPSSIPLGRCGLR